MYQCIVLSFEVGIYTWRIQNKIYFKHYLDFLRYKIAPKIWNIMEHMEVSWVMRVPHDSSSTTIAGIFHEINHPSGLGVPHDYGTPSPPSLDSLRTLRLPASPRDLQMITYVRIGPWWLESLVNVDGKLGLKSPVFNGKTQDFYGHVQWLC